MSNIVKEVISANKTYSADFGDKGELPMPSGRRFAILTCMDARLDPAKGWCGIRIIAARQLQ